MKSAHEEKERLVTWLLVGGLILFLAAGGAVILGVFGKLAMLFTAAPLFFLLSVISVGAGLWLGISHSKSPAEGAGAQREGHVMARYAINHLGEMIFSYFETDAEEAKYYVKLQYLDGRTEELQCAEPVFEQCGEGMRGMVIVHGRWLSRFEQLPMP